jgi:hypothetical protein
MPFLTPEQVKAVRLNKSKVVPIEGTDKNLRLVRFSSSAAIEFSVIQADVAAGKTEQKELFLYMLEHGCTDEAGEPLSKEDAQQLLDLLPLDTFLGFMADIKKAAELPKADPGKD